MKRRERAKSFTPAPLRGAGFTLVEIVVVAGIIGLLAAIAVPNFVTARTGAQINSCRANQKSLQGVVEMYMITTGITFADSNDIITDYGAVLTPTYLRTTPACSTTGLYTLTAGVVSCDQVAHQ